MLSMSVETAIKTLKRMAKGAPIDAVFTTQLCVRNGVPVETTLRAIRDASDKCEWACLTTLQDNDHYSHQHQRLTIRLCKTICPSIGWQYT